MTSRKWFAVVAVTLVTATTCLAGCGRPGPGEGVSQWRIVPASGLRFERPPAPGDTQLRISVTINALTDPADPVDHVDLRREPSRLGIGIWLRERVPEPDEKIPNYAGTHTETVRLDSPVGAATVVDLSADPPTPIPVGRTPPGSTK